MAVVYKHREKITMPVLHVFQSNAIRLKPGAIYESIQLYNVRDNIVKNENALGKRLNAMNMIQNQEYYFFLITVLKIRFLLSMTEKLKL